MLFTVKQVENGFIDITKLDLDKYAKKDEVVDKKSFTDLTNIVAGKLDSSPMHEHDISDIDQLEMVLNGKLDNKTYSYTTILSDPEKINYLEKVKSLKYEVSSSKDVKGYQIETDSVGDLKILLNGIVVASYNKTTSSWVFNGNDLNKFINEANDALKNHKEAIEKLQDLISPV